MIGNGNLPDDPAGLEQVQSGLLNKALSGSNITTGELSMRYFTNGGKKMPPPSALVSY